MTPSEREVDGGRPGAAPPHGAPRGACSPGRAEYQRIWMQLGSRDWRTLAVVPGEEGMSTYDVAIVLMELGVAHGESIGVFDFRDIRMNQALEVIRGAKSQLERGERIIFATRSIRENLATIPLARATDCAVLCVTIGSTSMDFAAETTEQIGKEHFLGSILIRAPRRGTPRPVVTEWQRRLEA